MNKHLALIAVLSLTLIGPVYSDTSGPGTCSAAEGLDPICGLTNAEDLLRIPNSNWILASGMANESDHSSGHLYLVDVVTRSAREIFPASQPRLHLDRSTFPDCPNNLDMAHFSAHGLALHALDDHRYRVFMTSHGGREAVEVFELETSTGQPAITWVGCVPIPTGNDINSVAALPDGGFLATRISGAGMEFDAIFEGKVSGFIYQWQSGSGLKAVAETDMSGPNGIIVSQDGREVWVGTWGGRELIRFQRHTNGVLQRDQTLPMSFRVDNLRWTEEGRILAAGHRLTTAQDCGQPLCLDEWEVAEIVPGSMTARTLLVRKPQQGFLGATAAIRLGDSLWLGTFHGDRILSMKVIAAVP